LKVLYIGGVGPFGGASRSLYESVGALPKDRVDAFFLMPRGTALDFYRRVATDVLAVRGVSRFDHTRASYYRGRRWAVLLRELFHAAPTMLGLLRARMRWGRFDIVHVNEFTEILPGLIAKHLLGASLVVHVRSLVNSDARLRRTRLLHRILARSADAVIAIDETVRGTLPADLRIDVIHNSFTAMPSERYDDAYLAQFERLRPTAFKIGFVGNLLRVKGVVELTKAAALVRRAGQDVQFVLVGGAVAAPRGIAAALTRRAGLAQNVEEEVRTLIVEYGLADDVILLGPTSDIQRVYPRMDVLVFPSFYDAPGRPVFEAAFSGVPSIVAVRNPAPDTLVDGETGVAIDEPTPELIAAAVIQLASDRARVQRMGEAARRLADRNFRPEANAARLLQLYLRTNDRSRATARPERHDTARSGS
jgi:glycosyltransferase involved in cell wall biosynthesis